VYNKNKICKKSLHYFKLVINFKTLNNKEVKMKILMRSILLPGAFLYLVNCGGGGGGKEDADVSEGDVQPEGEVEIQHDGEVDAIPDGEVDCEPVEISDPVETDGPSTVTIKGQVWKYTRMMETQYYVEPAGNMEVTLTGEGITPGTFSATTSTEHCEDWWDLGAPFKCGKFEISGVPEGAKVVARVAGLGEGEPETISKIFTAGEEPFVLLVVIEKALIDAVINAWGIPVSASNGMVVGILAQHLNPDATYKPGDNTTCPETPSSCVLSGFIGEATVEISPASSLPEDNKVIYFDSSDYTNTGRTNTDPEQSLFFVLNAPPRSFAQPYTISITHATLNIPSAQYTVEAENVTYLLLMP